MIRRLALIAAAAAALALRSAACECSGSGAPCKANETADIFAGTVIYASPSLEEQQSRHVAAINPYRTFRFTVEEDFSYLERREMEVRTSAYATACGYTFEVGRRYLVFAARNGTPNLWTTSVCSRTAPLDDPRAVRDLAYLRSLYKPGDHAVLWGKIGAGVAGQFDGPLSRVRVRLIAPGKVADTVTDLNGEFDFTGLPEGRYKVELPDFPRYSREMKVRENACEEADFLVEQPAPR